MEKLQLKYSIFNHLPQLERFIQFWLKSTEFNRNSPEKSRSLWFHSRSLFELSTGLSSIKMLKAKNSEKFKSKMNKIYSRVSHFDEPLMLNTNQCYYLLSFTGTRAPVYVSVCVFVFSSSFQSLLKTNVLKSIHKDFISKYLDFVENMTTIVQLNSVKWIVSKHKKKKKMK